MRGNISSLSLQGDLYILLCHSSIPSECRCSFLHRENTTAAFSVAFVEKAEKLEKLAKGAFDDKRKSSEKLARFSEEAGKASSSASSNSHFSSFSELFRSSNPP